ncbi:inner membrane transport permease YbhR [Anaerotignum neopropionicum]|uniref:Inner membrane transport permease YbhR n=1 Tax=Anaerotignum neopropionicum TaxID=36847 RepID=A0A136WEH4_9FIRM|nr:ABC transporter permease [Anaerotignum neopropionicum]KXL52897.1 inner membrane transport permease YbhR [Anaerotignum neopropionicum]
MILTFIKGFGREIKTLWLDKRMLFMFLIAPLALSIVVCAAFSGHVVNNIPLAVVDQNSSAQTRALIAAFDEADRFNVTYVVTEQDEAVGLMEEGEVLGVVIIPPDYTRSLQLGQQAEVLIGVNSANNIIGNSAVVSSMQVVKTISAQIAVKSFVAKGSTVEDATAMVMPISTVLRPWFNPQFSYLTYLGLGLTGLIFHQLFLMTVATAFAEEKKEGILSGKMKAKESIIHFINKYIFYGVTGYGNILVNYYAIITIFDFPMRGNREDVAILCGCYILCLLGVGALLGTLCKNTIHCIQWLMAMTYPLFILSGFSWPLTEMPEVLVKAAQYLPPTHFLVPVRNIVLTGVGFETESIVYSRDMLLYLAVGAFMLSLISFLWKVYSARKKEKPKLVEKEVVQA